MNPSSIPLSVVVFIEGAFIERVITSAPVQVASLDLDVEGTTSEDVVRTPDGLEFAGISAILSVDQGQSNPVYARSLFLAMPPGDTHDQFSGPEARRVLFTVKQGDVQSCLSDGNVRVLVLNRDTDGLDEADLTTFPYENVSRKGTFESEATWLAPTIDSVSLESAWGQLGATQPGPLHAPRRRGP